MATAGDFIKYSNLPTGWAESRKNITTNGAGSYNDGYYYISAPCFIIELQLIKDSFWTRSGYCNLFGSYYDWTAGTWSTEEKLCVVSGSPGDNISRYFAHNCPDSMSGITANARKDGHYNLWRMRYVMSSDTKKRTWWYIGNLGQMGETIYNTYFKGNKIYSCGNANNNESLVSGNSTKFLWVPADWKQDDSGALSYFNRVADRGSYITAENCNHMSS